MATAELISTGAELLNGRTVNRHGQVLGSLLRSIGIQLCRDTTVIDDRKQIAEAVRSACGRADYVFVTGGLGPTNDDVTREAVSDAVGRGLVADEGVLGVIESMYRARNQPFTEARQKQALVVDGAEVLPNPAGLAPGQRMAIGGAVVTVLPGPPREFLALMQEQVMPWLREQSGEQVIPMERVFMLCGIGESEVHDWIDAEIGSDGIEVSYCAAPSRVEVMFQGADKTRLDAAAGRMRERFAKELYAEKRMALEDAVAGLLQEGRTVAVAESCTGGLLGGRLTAVPGSSAWFPGGIIAYANEVKQRELGVRPETLAAHGAVSEATAREMAAGVRVKFGADFGIAITGIAGPDGGTEEKPVGLVYIGLSGRDGDTVTECRFSGERAMVRERAVLKALEMLWRRLSG